METFYLVDFENVHNEGLENIDSLSQTDHVHIFSTEKALNIRMDLVLSKGVNIEGHIVPVRKQSLDMHLVSYLGHLLGVHGKQCAYVIVSKDTDYDNIIKFWKEKGYSNISRKQKISGASVKQKKTEQTVATATTQTVNSRVSPKSKTANRESQVRSFFGQHFKEKKYINKKEKIIGIIINAKTKQQVNNELMKLYGDGGVVKHILQTIQPFIKELPGK